MMIINHFVIYGVLKTYIDDYFLRIINPESILWSLSIFKNCLGSQKNKKVKHDVISKQVLLNPIGIMYIRSKLHSREFFNVKHLNVEIIFNTRDRFAKISKPMRFTGHLKGNFVQLTWVACHEFWALPIGGEFNR